VGHIERLLTLGYIEEGLAGLNLTDLGALMLERGVSE
jgi:hypothetical protein